jgi:CIC family chloride channel protein
VTSEQNPLTETDAPVMNGPLARFKMSEHTFMVVIAVLIGVLGGFGAVGFRFLIKFLQRLCWGDLQYTLDLVRDHPWWWVLLIPAIGGAIVGPLVYFFAPEAKGHGVPEVMEAVALNSGRIRPRVVLVKAMASAISIASGGSVGREGPIVQIGSAIGSTFGQLLKVSGRNLRTLVGCGAAAGIAATFNAPIAGSLFAVEIILGDFGMTQFSPIVISSVIATVVSRHFLGDFPAFEVPAYGMVSVWELLIYLALGIVAAFVSITFVKTLYRMEDLWDRLRIKPWLLASIGGLIIGTMGLIRPEIFGVGYEAINDALSGQLSLGILGLLLLMKILATSVTLASGASGGIFAPSLFLGAMTGGLVGVIANHFFPGITAEPGAYALVGMGAVVAGTTHAPITAILIIFELTYDYKIIVPLMAACIITTLISSRLMSENIYTMKLIRRGVNLAAGREVNVLKALKVKTVIDDSAVVIPPDLHLNSILDIVATNPRPCIYVVRLDGGLLGAISGKEMRSAMLEAGALSDLLVAADLLREDIPVAYPEQDLDSIMRLFGGREWEELPVIESEGTRRFLGTISRGDLLEAYNQEIHRRDMVSGLASDLTDSKREAIYLGRNHWMREISVPGGFQNRTLKELDIRRNHSVQIVLVRRAAGVHQEEWMDLVPGPDTKLVLGDQIVVIGDKLALDRLQGV